MEYYTTFAIFPIVCQTDLCAQHLCNQALHMAHQPPMAAHPGALRTYQNLRNNWFFPNMLHLARTYVAGCENVVNGASLQYSAQGFRYVLSIIDHHTRYLQLVPLRDKSGSRVLKAFVDHFITLLVLQPNSTQIMAWSFLLLSGVTLKGVRGEHSFSVAYHPQSNGVVERSNRVVKDALATLVQRSPSQWPTHLPAVRFALNTAIHRSTRDQPLYLLTGRMALFRRGLTNLQTADEGLMMKGLAEARRIAIKATLETREANKRYYNRKTKPLHLSEGSLVLRMVEELQQPHRTMRVHANQLRPFVPASEIDFVEESDQLPYPPMNLISTLHRIE
ncbi:uncharacterized protein LOC119596729 [Penaeus monodon]|uniref:uncharacterized protein LOC119596729 n=1 Tax=Penaeus monodon TaxID=6687 RepID=UPI0018A737B3|nr:uncharacterized protein LOC119596729 [Penaeus monodon]